MDNVDFIADGNRVLSVAACAVDELFAGQPFNTANVMRAGRYYLHVRDEKKIVGHTFCFYSSPSPV